MTNRIQDFRRLGPAVADVIAAIARTMVAKTNSPQNHRNKDMNEQELESLNTVIRYLWRDEQKHFDERELNDGAAPSHAYTYDRTRATTASNRSARTPVLVAHTISARAIAAAATTTRAYSAVAWPASPFMSVRFTCFPFRESK